MATKQSCPGALCVCGHDAGINMPDNQFQFHYILKDEGKSLGSVPQATMQGQQKFVNQ